MTLTLNLNPELEQEIRAAAETVGEDVESFVLGAVKARLGGKPLAIRRFRDDAEWRAAFDEWLASRTVVNHFVDDSRESIYEGRGE